MPPQTATPMGGTMRTTTAALATAATLLLALTACSSSDDDTADPAPSTPATSPATAEKPTTTQTPADAADLEGAVKAYTAAYFKGDTKTGYATLSKRCAKAIDEALYEATVKQDAADYGTGHPATDVKADVSGTLARVSYKVKGLPKFDQEQQPWTREGGTWKYDAC